MVHLTHVLSIFLRRVFQRLIFIIFLISSSAYADYKTATIGADATFKVGTIFKTASEVCTAAKAAIPSNEYSVCTIGDSTAATDNQPAFVSFYRANGGNFRAADYIKPVTNTDCSTAPGVYNGNTINVQWQQNTPIPTKTCIPLGNQFCVATLNPIYVNISQSGSVAYTSGTATVQKTPVNQCSNQYDNACDPKDPYGKCYSPPNDGCTRQSNGSIVCPPDTPPPSPEPTCKYSTSGAYCTPQNGQCPSGYVTGNYNGQTICVKDSKNPPPTDPNNQQGDGACNGTGNCSPNSNNTTTNNHTTNNTTNQTTQNTTNNTTNNNTTNNTTNNEITQKLDDSGIIAAINTTSATIVQTITSKSEAIKTAVDAVKNTADSILDKLGIVDKSIKDAAQQAKTDAKTQLDETKKYGEQAKTDAKKQLDQDKAYQDWQKLTQKCAGATPPVTRDSFSNTNEASDFVNNTTTPSGNPSDVNMKLCKFSDSFQEYKDWIQGKGDNKSAEQVMQENEAGAMPWGTTTLPDIDTNQFNWTAHCPADRSVEIMNHSYSFSYETICNAFIDASWIVRALAWLTASFILIGAVRK